MRAFATGSTGFVGRALARALPHVRGIRLGVDTWRDEIARADLRDATIFHLAARVHGAADEDAFDHDNAGKTRELAHAAQRAGARRLVFLSSIKVNAEESERPIQRDDAPAPSDAYARSKWRAELALREAAQENGLDVVVVRAPLVIGDGARANLAALMRLVDTPWPLPFAAIRNRRTLIHVDDLAQLLIACVEAPRGTLFLAGHPQAVSTPQIVKTLRAAFGRPARLAAVPPALLEAGAAMFGQHNRVRRLTRSLEVDVADTLRELRWIPRISIEDGLGSMARAFRGSAR